MKTQKRGMDLLLLSSALLLSGCATTSSLMVPVLPSPQHTLEQPPSARLRIPVVIKIPKLSTVEKHLAEFVKEDFAKAEKSLTKSLGATVWWDPLTWESNGNSLTAHMHMHYKTANGVQPTGKEATLFQQIEKDAKIDLAAALQWNKDWHLEAPDFDEKPEATGDTQTAAAPEEETDAAKGTRLLRKGTSKFHEELKKATDLKAKAAEMWKAIQEPMRMAEDIWLQIKPDQVSVGSYHLVADPLSPRVETVFEVIAQPNIFFGDKPQDIKVEELPPIKDYKPGPEGFHIETNLRIHFNEVNKLLVDPKTGILNKALPGGGDHHLEITGIRVYGSAGRLVVEAQVSYQPIMNLSSQPAKLTVYLLGTPTYHEGSQTIDFPDLDFDIKTSDFLVQMADFIAGSGMREQLRKEAVIPVGKSLEELKAKLYPVLNRPLGRYARLHTTITSLKMKEAFISDYGLEGRVALDGDAAVDVNW